MNDAPQPLPLRDRGELLLARWIFHWNRWFSRPVKRFEGQPFRLYEYAAPDGTAATPNSLRIPRTIWAFWSGGEPPELIRRCFDNWRRMCPGFDIRILDEQAALHYLDAIPETLRAASAPKRADWVRVELLRRHGGIWLDASTILTTSLDWVIDEQARTHSDYVGFYLDQFTSDAARPVVENWFMAAPAASPFITDLQHEFTTRVVSGSNGEYIDALRAEGCYDELRQRIFSPEYLSMHLAIQYLLRKRGGYRLDLARAEDGPFFLHEASGWSRARLKVQLMMRPTAQAMPPLIKLRKPDRKRLALYMQRKLVRGDSVLGRYLDL
ncbi:glycosyltransferase family 32 protein [Diaphorobacter sp.]|uniref:glycosyltransferase family 32 protein n=1 Tax=Diaphorobacter sp. TaxID=1934310 RepID=UPI0028AA36EA|nr:capsular polysaccharide synthesis protein [Diaphorobacter sp.]